MSEYGKIRQNGLHGDHPSAKYLTSPESKKSLKNESKSKVNLENFTAKMIESDLLILKLNLTNTVQLSLADNDFKK